MEVSAGYSTDSEKVEGCGCSVEKYTGLVRPPCVYRHNTPLHANPSREMYIMLNDGLIMLFHNSRVFIAQ